MHRPRLIAPLAGLATALAVGPLLAPIALAADPIVVVKAGDTLTGISKRHGVDIATLVELNNLADPNRIYVGQRLVIVVAGTPAAAAPSQAAAADARVHVVAPGENLTRIAKLYGMTVAAIVDTNGIANPSQIFAGQRLVISGSPAAAPTAPAAPAAPAGAKPAVHVVAPGENLTRIAQHYGMTVAAIVDANGIANPSRIFSGQRLTIPRPSTTAKASPAAPAMPPSMAALLVERDAVRRMIVEEAARYEVPAALALAVAWQESGWQQDVVSHAGAVGIMQLMPATGEWVAEVMLGTPVDIRDARQNVRAGVRLLAHYLDHYDGDRDRLLAAYYQGQWATDHHGIYGVSRPYIASIKVLERLFGG